MHSSICVVLLCLISLHHLFEINECGSVTPTATNTSGEYYVLSNDGNNHKEITCSHSALCYIECLDPNSCDTSTINASSTDNLTLQCTAKNACNSTTITNGPQLETHILCTASDGYACSQSIFWLNNTKTVNLKCYNQLSYQNTNYDWGGCYRLTLWAQNAETVDIECEYVDCYLATLHLESVINKATLTATGSRGLQQSSVYATNANKLSINCNDEYACREMNIHPPYHSKYAFSLYCIPMFDSCEEVDIYAATFVANYMELVCPRKLLYVTTSSYYSDICYIRWWCDHLSSPKYSKTTFDTTENRYICSSYDSECCPWSDIDGMIQNTTDPGIIPHTSSLSPTVTNSSGEYYISYSTETYQFIYCGNPSGCYIDCISCQSVTVYAAVTNYLTLICTFDRFACNYIYITAGPKIEANIYCSGCLRAVIVMSQTPTINFQCKYCYSLIFYAEHAESVDVECVYEAFDNCENAVFHLESVKNRAIVTDRGGDGLQDAIIYAANANYLNVNCNSGCLRLIIEPPYNISEYAFSLYCGSCSDVTIRVPDSAAFMNNYMELECGYCDVSWVCLDEASAASSLRVSITKKINDTTNQYICTDKDSCCPSKCCPWADDEHMIQPPSISPTQAPTSNTNSPSQTPTKKPVGPSVSPTEIPTSPPTYNPSRAPTFNPTAQTDTPSKTPTKPPTKYPSKPPTENPTSHPTADPTKDPTIDPTFHPIPVPSFSPTASTAVPTSHPTVDPTKDPTIDPTFDPTSMPTFAPSSAPTFSPIAAPTGPPQISQETLRQMALEEDLNHLEETYQTILILFASVFGIISIASYLDAKYIRSNDYFNIAQITTIALQAMDMLSDCFFAVNLSIQYKNDDEFAFPLLFSIVFIVVPATMTVIQLNLQASKYWIRKSSEQVRGWLKKRSKALYLLSIAIGNSFAAVALVNSYIFKLSFFDMGLTEQELLAFSYKRVYSVVLLENMPQLLLQCWYLMKMKAFDEPIAISSIIFSLISVIVSVLSMMMIKTLSKNQGHYHIRMEVTGTAVEDKTTNCRTMKSKLAKLLAEKVFGVHHAVIEIIKPIPFSTGTQVGVEVKVNIYIADDIDATDSFIKANKKDYRSIIEAHAQDTKKLQEIFKKGWDLDDLPEVRVSGHGEVKSKERAKSEVADRRDQLKQHHHAVHAAAESVEMTKQQTTLLDEEGEVDNAAEGIGEIKRPRSLSNKGYDKVVDIDQDLNK